jgi:FkbM family methyltransferase
MKITKRDLLIGAGAAVCGAGAAVCASQLQKRLVPQSPPRPSDPQRPPYDYRVISYAQSGEDLIISFLLSYTLGIIRPTYIDVGAAHPTRINNTYLFYRRGARGVLVEPNVDLIPVLTSVRPEDKVLNIGIGVTDQAEADYYVCTVPDLNTFSKEEAAQREVLRVVKMPLVNINQVLAENFDNAPDLFSIDVEGWDLPILKSLDFGKYRPKIFCVETLVYGSTKIVTEIGDFMASQRYVPRAQTLPNTIYMDEDVLNK